MSQTTSQSRRAVFLDRDGVLNVYLPGDYVKSPDELVLLDDAAQAVARLNRADLPVYLISNQQGVAKGMMSHADLDRVDERLREGLALGGAHLDYSYYCPHAAGACDCRKPKGGMILRAAQENNLDLATSVFIGDTETDALAARAAGVETFVLVLTGKFVDAAHAADTALFPLPPSFVAASLGDAVEWTLNYLKTST